MGRKNYLFFSHIFSKVRVQNMLFKFVLDFELRPGLWMYGGHKRSDENAMKAASHELKGLSTFLILIH